MNDNINSGQSDEAILTEDVSDEVLEALAGTTTEPAFSFVGSPTVSVVFSCCGGD
jgi:hypothetical protein